MDWYFPFSYSSIGDANCLQIFCEFQLAICSRRLKIAQSNLPIKIATLWDNIAMLLAREHPVLTVETRVDTYCTSAPNDFFNMFTVDYYCC